MNSIIAMNKLPANKSSDWHSRLDEVHEADDARLKRLCRQHFSRFFDERVWSTKNALAEQKRIAHMSKTELREHGQWRLYDTPKNVFNSCYYMSRLDPGIAAIRKLAGEKLPPDLEALVGLMSQIISNMEDVRRWFQASIKSSKDRNAVLATLPVKMESYLDALQHLVLAFYLLAKERYDLLELNGTLQ